MCHSAYSTSESVGNSFESDGSSQVVALGPQCVNHSDNLCKTGEYPQPLQTRHVHAMTKASDEHTATEGRQPLAEAIQEKDPQLKLPWGA